MRVEKRLLGAFETDWGVIASRAASSNQRFLELFLSIYGLSNNKLCATCGKYGHQQ
jgi:hypothetical protein